MRILQAEPVHSSPIQHAASNRSSDWTHMVRVTLLAMAASLLFLTCKSQALTTTTDTNTQAAVAQTPNPSSNAVAPGPEAVTQNVRVVRLSDVEGTVQIVRDNQTEFSHAVMNMPLTQGTQIETGPDGRAEVEFEDGSVTRITPNSTLSLAKLSTSSTGTLETTLEQPKGLVYYELRSDPRSAFSVDFDNNKVNPTVNSTFRVNLGANPAELAVIDGNVQVQGTASQTATAVPQGKTIELQPSGSSPYTLADGIVPNGFDQWNDQRDEEAAKQAASQTTARAQQGGGSMLEGGWGYGWGNLDAYGGWYPLPGYGMVWQPYGAGPGFNPYGYGSWANIGGFGVSWISGYPWGWLPFQCGGWSYIGSFGWGWMPGGCGFGWGVGFGYGYGYGGYYGRRYYYQHNHPGWGRGTARIYSAPAGYHIPAAPASLRSGVSGGRPGENIVHVGTPATAARGFTNNGHAENHARTIDFNGSKIEPLHRVSRGENISLRNAALVNNAPARSLSSGFSGHDGLTAGRGADGVHGGNEFRGAANNMRSSSFNSMRASQAAEFQARNSFGNDATFGSHGSFHGSTPSFGGGFHGSVSSGAGFHGASSSGGFHGGSGGGGFHGGGGGGGFGGGGGHGGGGGGGGGGHH